MNLLVAEVDKADTYQRQLHETAEHPFAAKAAEQVEVGTWKFGEPAEHEHLAFACQCDSYYCEMNHEEHPLWYHEASDDKGRNTMRVCLRARNISQ